MLSGIHTTKPRTQRYIDAFVKGSGQGRIYHFRELKELPKEDLTMYGILAGSGEVYKDCEKENKKMKVRAQMKKKLVVNVRSNIFRNVQKFDFTQRWTLHFSNISDLSRYNILETFNDICNEHLKEGRR